MALPRQRFGALTAHFERCKHATGLARHPGRACPRREGVRRPGCRTSGGSAAVAALATGLNPAPGPTLSPPRAADRYRRPIPDDESADERLA